MRGRIEFIAFERAKEASWIETEGVVVLLGENGSGKSRLLGKIEQESRKYGRPTYAIANTPYNRFRGPSNGAKRFIVGRSASSPERVIKEAVASADEVALRRMSRALRHCGYLPDIGIEIDLTPSERRDLRELKELESTLKVGDEVRSLCAVLLRPDFPSGIIWFNFDSGIADYSYRSVLPKVLRWEKVLKRLKILKKTHVYVRKPDCEMRLSEASSGELSLISTIAYLSAVSEEGATVLVDEPENSLHPRWQREYLDLLLESLKYRGGRVVIASHSPLIVSAAIADDASPLAASSTRILVVTSTTGGDGLEAPPSVEGLLAEAFNVVTPANHYLSQALVRLLDRVDRGEIDAVAARDQLASFRGRLPDERQLGLIEAVDAIIGHMSEGKLDLA